MLWPSRCHFSANLLVVSTFIVICTCEYAENSFLDGGSENRSLLNQPGGNWSTEEAPNYDNPNKNQQQQQKPIDDNYYDYDFDGTISKDSDVVGIGTTPEDIYPDPEKLYRPKAALSSEIGEEDEKVKADVAQIGDETMKVQASNFVLGDTASSGGTSGNGIIKSKSIMKSRDASSTKNDVLDYDLVDNIDQDFKGHDLIDSIMYIYYGSNNNTALRTEVGGNIIVIGAVVALAAQILTIILLFLKNRQSRHKNLLIPVIMPLLIMTFLSNFTFIVGVQSSRNVYKCEIIAIILHYLHLSTTFWDFLYIFCIYDFIKNNIPPNLHFLLSMGFGMPMLYIIFNYIISSSNYEVNNYCWMSVKKGMIINYMIPISFFIIITAIYGTLCLRMLRNKQREQFTESIESFIEHSKSEQMLNHVRTLDNQQLPIKPADCHRTLGRCHSNPNTATAQKKMSANLKAKNMANSSINLTATSPRLSTLSLNGHRNLDRVPTHCSDTILANHIDQNFVSKERSFCESMVRRRGFCDSKYEIGSLSLANLSLQSLSSESEDFEDYKCAVKFAILFQIMFSICWFLAVIALEYQDSSVMPIVFVIVHNLLNWILLAKSNCICPLMTANFISPGAHQPEYPALKNGSNKLKECEEGTVLEEKENLKNSQDNPLIGPYDEEEFKRKISTDTIPLLYSNKSNNLRANHIIPDSTTIESSLPLDCDNSVIEEPINSPKSNSPQQANNQNAFPWTAPNPVDSSTNPEFISTIST